VSTVVKFPMALAVPASSPIRTFNEYAQWVRARPENANFGHAASGGPTHFLGLQFARKIRMLGFVNTGSSPAEARAKFSELRGFWSPVVKASGFKAD
jgi:tripartite-type tricarboxylate transporter receptor subunit TctC